MPIICAIWSIRGMTDVDVLVIPLSFAVTLPLTILVRKILLRRNLLDMPNERSSHSQPVPRGGGWAVVVVLLPGMVAAGLMQRDLLEHAGLLAGAVLLVLISWLDDKKGVSARARLSFHLLAACLGSLCFPPPLMLFGGALPFAADRAVMVIGWAWFMNLYNFMDGIDGITGAETVAIATGVCLVMSAAGMNDPFVSTLTLLLTGSCLGFLALNWHPAKIFLGDVGSVPLGYLTGFCLLALAVRGHPIPALILPLYYLADSGITLARRALRGEKIWQAHRQHFYQKAALGAGRHDKVVALVSATNIGLILAALLAVSHPAAGLAAGVLMVALLLRTLHKLVYATSAP
jgi:UDP-N-acetylmuramyl pentapeptide phosphotransferase/UDP-N-acetylglucosamine-1-phosphate transferase